MFPSYGACLYKIWMDFDLGFPEPKLLDATWGLDESTLDLWVSAAGNLSSLPESPAPPLPVAMFLRLCFAATLCTLTAAAPGGLRTENKTVAERSANGCDCSWIANDDCINQDACANSCRQSYGGPCASGGSNSAACQATCDSSFASCNRWCHIPPGGGPYYTPAQEEALKGQIMQCEGSCTTTRGGCYSQCR